LGTDEFPIQKCAIFRKFKEIKELRGGVLAYAAQAIPPIDAEIVENGHLWTETISKCRFIALLGVSLRLHVLFEEIGKIELIIFGNDALDVQLLDIDGSFGGKSECFEIENAFR
jgi:hypothetical protein